MDYIDYEKIGGRIRAVRESQGLTQEAASERCGITAAFYGNIERGDRKMSVETLIKIAAGLGVSADVLLFGESSARQDTLGEILGNVQRCSDEAQFQKFLMIVKTLSAVIDKL